MTTNHHTPIASGAAADNTTFNAPLGELDAELTAQDARIGALEGDMPVPSGNPTEYYDGDGNWTVPAGTGAGVDGHVIQSEGVDMIQRAKVNFVGAGVTVTNEAGGTQVEIPGGGGGVTDHGDLTGLSNDDHPQYLLKSGLRDWDEQASAPATPASGKWKLYFKSNGLYFIDDAGVEVGPLNVAIPESGWIEVADAWTYAGPNTINIPAGGASIYKKGMGIRIKQGGAYKYYYNILPVDTLLTVTGGADYTVANAAITDIAITLTPATAIGFPVTFALAAATWNLSTIDNGSGGQPTAGTQYFSIQGNAVTLAIVLGGAGAVKVGTDNLIAFTIPPTLPAISEPTLLPLGNAYTVAGAAGVGGVCVAQNTTDLNLRYSANITDNTTVPYTGTKTTYKY